jgi:hydroxymethylbilane synthase
MASGLRRVPIRTTGRALRAAPALAERPHVVRHRGVRAGVGAVAHRRALVEGEIDVAVHSAKDVPTSLPEGLELVGCLPREDPRDALCGSLRTDGRPARVGTSSLRRAAQLRAIGASDAAGHGIEVVEIRGNVDTRLGKLAAGEVDAVVLAYAGLRRLERADAVDELLDDLVPAAGQGTVVLEARAGLAVDLLHEPTWRALTAERACVHALGADCASAVGAFLQDDGTLVAWVGSVDGSAWLRDELHVHGLAPEALGIQVAQRLLSAGARDLLHPDGEGHP